MPSQNFINMLVMTVKYVVECRRFLLKMLNLLRKILLFGLQKVGKANKNWLGLVDKLKIISISFFPSKVILFKETIKFKDAINIRYSRQKIYFHNKIPILQTWVMAQKVSNFLIVVAT